MPTNKPKKSASGGKKGSSDYVMFNGVKFPKQMPKDPKERAKWEKKFADTAKKMNFD